MLTDAKIRAAKPRERPYRIGDSGQLYLQITPAGGRLWRMNYSFGRNQSGKPLQKTLSFGAYPAVSLADARERRDEAKRLLAKGLDPAVVWRNEADHDSASAADAASLIAVLEPIADQVRSRGAAAQCEADVGASERVLTDALKRTGWTAG
jgi:hypothetical protein